jgi:hypothetical protein
MRLVKRQLTIAAIIMTAPAAITPYADASSQPKSAASANPTTSKAAPAIMSALKVSAWCHNETSRSQHSHAQEVKRLTEFTECVFPGGVELEREEQQDECSAASRQVDVEGPTPRLSDTFRDPGS